MELTLSTILIALAVLVVLGLIFVPKFRQGARIRVNKAADGMSSNIEKMEDELEQLMKKLPAQEDAVKSVMAASTQAEQDLEIAEAEVATLYKKYVEGKASGAPESVLDKYAQNWEKAKEDAAEKRANAEELDREEEEAISALEETTEALADYEDDIERAGAKVELTKAINIATEARKQAEATKSSISRSGKAARAIDNELEKARAGRQLSKGSRAEQEVEAWEKEQKTKSARAALDALTGDADAAGEDAAE